MTLHRYLLLITPSLPSLSLFAPPFLFSCHHLPLLSSDALVLLLVSSARCALFSTRRVNETAWFHQRKSVSLTRRDPDEISRFFSYTAIHHNRVAAWAFTHGDARQLAKRNVSSSVTAPTFSPSLELCCLFVKRYQCLLLALAAPVAVWCIFIMMCATRSWTEYHCTLF